MTSNTNKEKAKSRKKREELEVHLDKLEELTVGDETLSGEDLKAHADALAGARKAMAAIKSVVDEAEAVLRAASHRHYCTHLVTQGRAPDLRRLIAGSGSLQVIQQRTAKITKESMVKLKSIGIDLEKYNPERTYTVRMGNASKQATKKIVASLKRILGEDYKGVVSESFGVGSKFFDKFDAIVKDSLGENENLQDKMYQVIRILNPTVQFKDIKSDLEEGRAFDLAHEFATISAKAKNKKGKKK